MPKINGNEIRPGNVLEHNDGLWAAVKVDHVKPGKGGAFAQVELRNLRNGSKLNERFRSADKVERVRLEQKDQQFLYESDGMLVFMDSETYEQVELPVEILGERRPFLQDGMTITIEYYESEALNADAPAEGDLHGGGDRAGGERPDRGQQLQAGGSGQRRADHDPALRGAGRGDRREYRDHGVFRAGLTLLFSDCAPSARMMRLHLPPAGAAGEGRCPSRSLGYSGQMKGIRGCR